MLACFLFRNVVLLIYSIYTQNMNASTRAWRRASFLIFCLTPGSWRSWATKKSRRWPSFLSRTSGKSTYHLPRHDHCCCFCLFCCVWSYELCYKTFSVLCCVWLHLRVARSARESLSRLSVFSSLGRSEYNGRNLSSSNIYWRNLELGLQP